MGQTRDASNKASAPTKDANSIGRHSIRREIRDLLDVSSDLSCEGKRVQEFVQKNREQLENMDAIQLLLKSTESRRTFSRMLQERCSQIQSLVSDIEKSATQFQQSLRSLNSLVSHCDCKRD